MEYFQAREWFGIESTRTIEGSVHIVFNSYGVHPCIVGLPVVKYCLNVQR